MDIIHAPLYLSNGGCRSNSGIRQIVLSPRGEVREVARAQWSGYQPDRCTFQIAREGDLVVRVTWWPEQWSVLLVQDGELQDTGPMGLVRHQALIQGLSKEAEAFLNGGMSGRQPSFLPAGLGWDGRNTAADVKKEGRIRGLFRGLDEAWVDAVVAAARVSKKDGLPSFWKVVARDSATFPAVLDAPARTWGGSMVDIQEWTQWVLWHRDGAVELVTPAPTEGERGSNYAHTERRVYNAAPVPMPATVVRACRITRGAYTRDHSSYGVRWELFAR